MEGFFKSLLSEASEDKLKMFGSRFTEIPMDVMTALKGDLSDENQLGQAIIEEYRALCRDVPSQPSQSARCYYRSSSPSSRLDPERIEVFHENPDILMIHDIISPSTADRLVSLSEDKLVGRV